MKNDDLTNKRLPAAEEQALLPENVEKTSIVVSDPPEPTVTDPVDTVPPISTDDIPETRGMGFGGVAAILALAVIVMGAILFFATRGTYSENYHQPIAHARSIESIKSTGVTAISSQSIPDASSDIATAIPLHVSQLAAKAVPSGKKFVKAPVVVYLFPTNGQTVADNGTLDKLAGSLAKSGKDVTIVGYTDESGSIAYNQKLSKRRADSVADYLIAHGVAPDHISAKGGGPTHAFKNAAADRCAVITVL